MTSDQPRRMVSAAYVARQCDITKSAVSNWLARKTLPADLEPEMVQYQGGERAQWREDQLPGLLAWSASHAKQKRTHPVTVTLDELKPGDVVVSVVDGKITVRRKIEGDGNGN